MSRAKMIPADCAPDVVAECNRFVLTLHHWRWIPGMLSTDGARCVEVTDAGPKFWSSDATCIHAHPVPDLADPATRGCLLDLVREVWNAPNFYPALGMFGFFFRVGGNYYPSELEALVAALADKKPGQP